MALGSRGRVRHWRKSGAAVVPLSSTTRPDSQFVAAIDEARIGPAEAATPTALPGREAQAANVYGSAWSTFMIRFARKDQFRLPAHWPLFLVWSSSVSSPHNRSATRSLRCSTTSTPSPRRRFGYQFSPWGWIRGWGSCMPISSAGTPWSPT